MCVNLILLARFSLDLFCFQTQAEDLILEHSGEYIAHLITKKLTRPRRHRHVRNALCLCQFIRAACLQDHLYDVTLRPQFCSHVSELRLAQRISSIDYGHPRDAIASPGVCAEGNGRPTFKKQTNIYISIFSSRRHIGLAVRKFRLSSISAVQT